LKTVSPPKSRVAGLKLPKRASKTATYIRIRACYVDKACHLSGGLRSLLQEHEDRFIPLELLRSHQPAQHVTAWCRNLTEQRGEFGIVQRQFLFVNACTIAATCCFSSAGITSQSYGQFRTTR